ncbi:hypothetical protein [Variovorax sp. GB1P17]|uniref:hypothetical protein n=1 Tax=Variovorax sp. GB1P17 TaxID=3443740 RepID=UPI003F493C6B
MLPDTPSAQATAAARMEAIVKTDDGRTITLKKAGILAQFKMVEMLGEKASMNGVFMNMVFPLMYVSAIDGEPVSRISTRNELDALITRLDEDGIAAVVKGVADNFGAPADADATKASVKN